MNTHSPHANNSVAAELSNPQARERMVHVALSILRDGPEAEDAAHDAVHQALRCAESFRAESLVSTWLHRVTVNAALMRVRTQRRAVARAAANDQTGQADEVDALEDADRTPVAQIEEQEDHLGLRRAVAQLPRTYQDVIQLCVFEEVPLPDAARSLGITSQAARTRMFRARAQLRERLAT
ncbi:MAG: sigma-70 family RNA polymerase sigma factor [Polyangia bacterium]|jgi:RNA polymerase sigma-70 factor (ECF subfamily)